MKPQLHTFTAAQIERLELSGAHSVCFVGKPQTGKLATALWLARLANCQIETAEDDCPSCKLVKSGNHPDVLVVAPAEGKAGVGIEQVHTLQRTLKLSLQLGRQRVVIIDQAGSLTPEAQNALLKTLEEPPAKTTIILIAENEEALLPTVRSRCRQIIFVPAHQEQDKTQVVTIDQLADLTLFSKLQFAAQLADSEQRDSTLAQWGSSLRRALRQAAATGNAAVVQVIRRQIKALEAAHTQLNANVSPRLTLEGLVLEV